MKNMKTLETFKAVFMSSATIEKRRIKIKLFAVLTCPGRNLSFYTGAAGRGRCCSDNHRGSDREICLTGCWHLVRSLMYD